MKRLWLSMPRWLRNVVRAFLCLLLAVLLLVGAAWWYFHPSVDRTDGVTYGERNGAPLTMDIVKPKDPNGRAIAVMVSGSWKSGEPGETPTWLMAPLLRRGYTVFAICHISQPEATVMEIIEDVHRGVRFVRCHADEHGIDPDKIGVTGGSAGGHLSLMLATTGGVGPADSADELDQFSSEVQAVAIFYPVTDLLNLGASTENAGDGGPPKSYLEAFGFLSGYTDLDADSWTKIGRDCSPIYFVDENLPPTLIHHGDADTLVPLEQSEWYRDRASKLGAEVKLVVEPGGGHGWLTMIYDVYKFGDWFDKHLR